nr:MAG TPA: hypothetical protein [Caudoviricetes sp.]
MRITHMLHRHAAQVVLDTNFLQLHFSPLCHNRRCRDGS